MVETGPGVQEAEGSYAGQCEDMTDSGGGDWAWCSGSGRNLCGAV